MTPSRRKNQIVGWDILQSQAHMYVELEEELI